MRNGQKRKYIKIKIIKTDEKRIIKILENQNKFNSRKKELNKE